MMDDLSPTEKTLFKEMSITYFPGKGNHLVSCFLPHECQEVLDVLVDTELRKDMGIDGENKFVFANTEESVHHFEGWAATN